MNPFEIPDFNQLYQQAQNNQGRRLLQHFASMREQLAQNQPVDQPLPVVIDRPINQNFDLIQNQSFSDLVQPVHFEAQKIIAQHLEEQWIQLTQPLEDLLQQSDTELDEICDSLTLLNQPFSDSDDAKYGLAQIFFPIMDINLNQPIELQIMSIIQNPEDYPKNAAKVNILSKIFNVIEIIYGQPILIIKKTRDIIKSLKLDGFQYRRDFQIGENFFLRFSEYFYYYKPLFSSMISQPPFNQMPKSINKRKQLIEQFNRQYLQQVADLLNQINIEPINLITEVPYTQLKEDAKVILIGQIQSPILPQLQSFLYSEPIDLTCLQHICFLESRQVVDHIISLLENTNIQSKDDINLDFIFHTMTYLQRDQGSYYIGSQQNNLIQQYIQGIYSNFIQDEVNYGQLDNLLDISLSQSFNDPTQHSQQIIQCNMVQIQSINCQIHDSSTNHCGNYQNNFTQIFQDHPLHFHSISQKLKMYTFQTSIFCLKQLDQVQVCTLHQSYKYPINFKQFRQFNDNNNQQPPKTFPTNYNGNQSHFFYPFNPFFQGPYKSDCNYQPFIPKQPNEIQFKSEKEITNAYYHKYNSNLLCSKYYHPPYFIHPYTCQNRIQQFYHYKNKNKTKHALTLLNLFISSLVFQSKLINLKMIQIQLIQAKIIEITLSNETFSKTPSKGIIIFTNIDSSQENLGLTFSYQNQNQILSLQPRLETRKQTLKAKYYLIYTYKIIIVLQLISLAQRTIIKALNSYQCVHKIT